MGVFIGVVLGLAIAAGIAFYIMRSGSPYQAANATKESREVNAPRSAKGEATKPRFDFYKILPGGEDPKVQTRTAERMDKSTVERATGSDTRASTPSAPEQKKPADQFWLQAGSFSDAADAEGLKARLALAGWEAAVQEATVPDKGVRYRVRLGPFDNTDELNRMKGELSRRGFDVAVIKF